jgi:hypothetical protein
MQREDIRVGAYGPAQTPPGLRRYRVDQTPPTP